MNTLEKQFEFYKKHQKDLVEKYEGKFLVIKDEEVKGAYSSEIEAYEKAKGEFELGTFLIQLAEKGEESYTQTFYSRV